MPPIAVYEVATFYTMYNQQPVGRFKLNVCTNLPCELRDGQQALEHLCHKLGIDSRRDHRRRRVHGAEERVPGRLRRRAGDAGQRPPDVQLHERRPARRAGRRAASSAAMQADGRPCWTCPDSVDRRADLFPRPPHRRRRSMPASTAATGAWRLRGARRLRGAAEDPRQRRRRSDDARAGDRRGQDVGACAAAAAPAFRPA